jgi:hypothetical protein
MMKSEPEHPPLRRHRDSLFKILAYLNLWRIWPIFAGFLQHVSDE